MNTCNFTSTHPTTISLHSTTKAKENKKSWTDPKFVIAASLAIGSLALIGYLFYKYNNNANNISFDYARNHFTEVVRPICDRAVRERRSCNDKLRLGDYIHPDWEASPTLNQSDAYPRCPATIKREYSHLTKDIYSREDMKRKTDCSSYFKIYAEGQQPFCTVLTEQELKHPVIQWTKKYYETAKLGSDPAIRKREDGKVEMCFKTHLGFKE